MPREAIARGGAVHTAPLARIPAVIAECLASMSVDDAASKNAPFVEPRRRLRRP
jgi:hypothetical protein